MNWKAIGLVLGTVLLGNCNGEGWARGHIKIKAKVATEAEIEIVAEPEAQALANQ